METLSSKTDESLNMLVINIPPNIALINEHAFLVTSSRIGLLE